PIYDIIERIFSPYRARSIAALQLKPDEQVLIVGAGTGLDLPHLSTQQMSISAIDLTPAMIGKLKKKAKKLDLSVEAKVMNAQQLDFKDQSFDAVILHLIVAVVPDPVQCLQEVARVLKPEGRFTIMDKFITVGRKPPLYRRLLNLITRVLFTDINRDIDVLLTQVPLEKQTDEPLFSIFRLIQGVRT
ncbi:MAG: methyltransferase domain-containing protein, partial [Bacteroidota bacterium]